MIWTFAKSRVIQTIVLNYYKVLFLNKSFSLIPPKFFYGNHSLIHSIMKSRGLFLHQLQYGSRQHIFYEVSSRVGGIKDCQQVYYSLQRARPLKERYYRAHKLASSSTISGRTLASGVSLIVTLWYFRHFWLSTSHSSNEKYLLIQVLLWFYFFNSKIFSLLKVQMCLVELYQITL